jgi:hypothetical protein
MSRQKPCGETFETSTDEVPVPSGADFIGVFLDQGQRQPDLSVVQTMILREGYLGLKPELCFPIRAFHGLTRPQVRPRRFVLRSQSVTLKAMGSAAWR